MNLNKLFEFGIHFRTPVQNFRYAEIGNYDFQTGKQKKGRENRVIGHFTEMVWKTAQKVNFLLACQGLPIPNKM